MRTEEGLVPHTYRPSTQLKSGYGTKLYCCTLAHPQMPHPQNAPTNGSFIFAVMEYAIHVTFSSLPPPLSLPHPSPFPPSPLPFPSLTPPLSLPHPSPLPLPLLPSPSLAPPPTPHSKLFFRRWFEVVDLVVILVTTLVTILYVILDEHEEEDSETGNTIIS